MGEEPEGPHQSRRRSRGRLISTLRAVSSAGRAPALQAGGRRFDPVTAHRSSKPFAANHDALLLCELLAKVDPARYERAALRWLERFINERLPPLTEIALAASALAELRHGRRNLAWRR
jgi:hypothetical protein